MWDFGKYTYFLTSILTLGWITWAYKIQCALFWVGSEQICDSKMVHKNHKMFFKEFSHLTLSPTFKLKQLFFKSRVWHPTKRRIDWRTATEVFRLKNKFSTSFSEDAIMLNPNLTNDNVKHWVPELHGYQPMCMSLKIQWTLWSNMSIFSHNLKS